jgi:hypothetical protein
VQYDTEEGAIRDCRKYLVAIPPYSYSKKFMTIKFLLARSGMGMKNVLSVNSVLFILRLRGCRGSRRRFKAPYGLGKFGQHLLFVSEVLFDDGHQGAAHDGAVGAGFFYLFHVVR